MLFANEVLISGLKPKQFADLQYKASSVTMKSRKLMEVPEMFRHKAEKRIVELSPEQVCLAKYALLEFRNELLAQGKPTEDVNELLLKIMK